MSMSLTNLPVSKDIAKSTPAIVILVTYCMLPKVAIFCTVEVSPRRLRAAGGGPERVSRGRIMALVNESKRIVRKESGDIKERIESGDSKRQMPAEFLSKT